MSKGPAVGNSQEELPVKGAAQRRTDGNDNQHHPQQHPGGLAMLLEFLLNLTLSLIHI